MARRRAARAGARRAARMQNVEGAGGRPSPRKPDCCQLRVLTYGMTRTTVEAIGNSIDVDQNLKAATVVTAAAHTEYDVTSEAMDHADAAAVATGGPAADSHSDAVADAKADSKSDAASDSGADTAVGLKEKKGKDLIAKVDSFVVVWDVINATGPVVVSVTGSGLIEGTFLCASKKGQLELANLKVVESGQPLVKGYAQFSVTATDGCGGSDSCGFRLREG